MFTGIIEEIGKISGLNKKSNLLEIKVSCKKVLENTKYGDSIATNGVCLTVTELGSDYFKAEIMKESLDHTTFSKAALGNRVNLERALLAGGRLDGHMVQGHVDGIGKVRKIVEGQNLVEYIIGASNEVLDYVVQKGSICIDGISLTVSDVGDDYFKVSIIPTTLKETILPEKRIGDEVNIETDILGRYVLKMLRKTQGRSKITEEFLRDNGF